MISYLYIVSFVSILICLFIVFIFCIRMRIYNYYKHKIYKFIIEFIRKMKYLFRKIKKNNKIQFK